MITELIHGQDLSVDDSRFAMNELMSGGVPPAQIAGFLVALRAKGETVDELVGFRDAILAHSVPVALNPHALDIVGTGGDKHGTVNISTMAAIVLASAGVPVIKHGNRAATSKSGSSDVLSALGVNLDINPGHIEKVFSELGIAFLFAAKFHPGFRNVAEVRKELGIPTVFNILGPLCNPARPDASAVGVATESAGRLISEVFAARGATALVFRGSDGLDELTTTGHSKILEVHQGDIHEHLVIPEDFGIEKVQLSALHGGDAEHNALIATRLLEGDTGPVRDVVLLNAAAGMAAFRLAQDATQVTRPIRERIHENVAVLADAIDSGRAHQFLRNWAAFTQQPE